MRNDTLFQQHPPTPPEPNVKHMSGMQHPALFGTDRTYSYDGGSDLVSPGSVASKSGSVAARVDSHSGEGLQLYDEYDPSTSQYYQNAQFSNLPHGQNMFSPPTPRSTAGSESHRRMSSNGTMITTTTTSDSPQHMEDSPKPKATPRSRKAKANKDGKAKTPKLTAPLSVSTKELTRIPVKDMEEWVNRSAEVRRKEADKRNGYITRPMNSFMLYRSAYAERAKAWCLQNNHQVVSSVAGESWPLEPTEIRDLYTEYAKIERINHQNAHPSYKFSPSKATVPARRRRSDWTDEEDEASDMDDAEYVPGSNRSRSRQARRIETPLTFTAGGLGHDYFERAFAPHNSGINKWETTSEVRPMPMPMTIGHPDVYNQYYQTAAYQPVEVSQSLAPVMRMRRIDSPNTAGLHFPTNQALLGLPGGDASDLMAMQSQVATPFDEVQMDPILMSYEGSNAGDIDPATLQHSGLRHAHGTVINDKVHQHHMDSLLDMGPSPTEYHASAWQSDPTMMSIEQESEFDQWMRDH